MDFLDQFQYIEWQKLFDWDLAIQSTPFVLQGLWNTVWISIVAMIIGLLLAFFTAIARMSNRVWLYFPAQIYISIIRGTPLLVQLVILYFGLQVINIKLTPIAAALIGLSLNVGGYAAETIRGALLSVPKGQWEAAQSINMTYGQTMRRIIIPQATRVALPPLSNTFLALVKDTSLLSVITVPEMLYQAKIVGGRELDYMTMYILVAFFYWIICTLLSMAQNRLEKHFNRFL
ncbi:amino acid ABC transporter membrane protein, PAAT family [Seinonella peptonophila]|uniref:Amino acid ABC transporter membrane protein, PAAT family n=1 Tax=Seinonella peptonophila TaxID=112248 RepID=A0A1M4TPW0_9BACL|nr:amino acid ABC transporter permease [Seinonella peptonophila]SHE46522.1 amino acid ABC transporter membrane protein, PAAT family [Seinonella peptonophila]